LKFLQISYVNLKNSGIQKVKIIAESNTSALKSVNLIKMIEQSDTTNPKSSLL
jgi:hypothetical protein